ncbi:ABC transporter ATP-binding protein [Lewinellaceae bacterium SD302]|nr:ABC transporter ATP-binding protein [Lewinellaceae bacterium SD302]
MYASDSNNSPILRLDRLVKNYGDKVAVNNVSFTMPPDAILGLLGPNGAGKTSIIRMITTITHPDAGTVFFEGEPLSSYHPTQIGYLPEERGLYKKMYVGEQLLYLAQLKGLSKRKATDRAREWLTIFELEDQWDKKVEELSKGMQQQVQFIATVIHEPRLLILDEPFSGLDPVNATRMREEILKLRDKGTGIIFSTHRMEQVEELCEYIVLINQGENVLEGRLSDIRRQFRTNEFLVTVEGEPPSALLEKYAATLLAKNRGEINSWTAKVAMGTGQDSNDMLRDLLATNAKIQTFQEILPSLNDIFIQQVGPENIDDVAVLNPTNYA